MDEQAALTEETWQSHTALEARVAKTEDRLCETGQQLMIDKSHVLVSAHLERRLGEPPHLETVFLVLDEVERTAHASCKRVLITTGLLYCSLTPAFLYAEGQEAAQAQQARRNQGLEARVAELEQQLKGAFTEENFSVHPVRVASAVYIKIMVFCCACS